MKRYSGLLLVCASVLVSGPALARDDAVILDTSKQVDFEQERDDFFIELSGEALTDYVDKGISQTDSDPAAQLAIAAVFREEFYLEVFATNVDFGGADDEDYEVDYTAGFVHEFDNALAVELGFTRVTFPGADSSADLDCNEYFAAAEYPFGDFGAGLEYIFSSDCEGDSGDFHYVRGVGNQPLTEWSGAPVSLNFGLGYANYEEGDPFVSSYVDWLAGVQVDIGDHISAFVEYTDTDISSRDCDPEDTCDARVFLRVAASFAFFD